MANRINQGPQDPLIMFQHKLNTDHPNKDFRDITALQIYKLLGKGVFESEKDVLTNPFLKSSFCGYEIRDYIQMGKVEALSHAAFGRMASRKDPEKSPKLHTMNMAVASCGCFVDAIKMQKYWEHDDPDHKSNPELVAEHKQLYPSFKKEKTILKTVVGGLGAGACFFMGAPYVAIGAGLAPFVLTDGLDFLAKNKDMFRATLNFVGAAATTFHPNDIDKFSDAITRGSKMCILCDKVFTKIVLLNPDTHRDSVKFLNALIETKKIQRGLTTREKDREIYQKDREIQVFRRTIENRDQTIESQKEQITLLSTENTQLKNDKVRLTRDKAHLTNDNVSKNEEIRVLNIRANNFSRRLDQSQALRRGAVEQIEALRRALLMKGVPLEPGEIPLQKHFVDKLYRSVCYVEEGAVRPLNSQRVKQLNEYVRSNPQVLFKGEALQKLSWIQIEELRAHSTFAEIPKSLQALRRSRLRIHTNLRDEGKHQESPPGTPDSAYGDGLTYRGMILPPSPSKSIYASFQVGRGEPSSPLR